MGFYSFERKLLNYDAEHPRELEANISGRDESTFKSLLCSNCVSLSLWETELNLLGMAVAGPFYTVDLKKCLAYKGTYHGTQNYYSGARLSQFTFLLFHYLVVRPHACYRDYELFQSKWLKSPALIKNLLHAR